jgi:hypothetical protein
VNRIMLLENFKPSKEVLDFYTKEW